MADETSSSILSTIFLGRRYSRITSLNMRARYATMTGIFTLAMVPLGIFGLNSMADDPTRATINFGIVGVCILSLTLMRTRLSLRILPLFPVSLFGLYCLFLLYGGGLYLWLSVWIFAFPLIAIFLLEMFRGVIASILVIGAASALLYMPGISAAYEADPQMKFRYIAGFVFVLFLTIIFERVNMLKDKKEEALHEELTHERDKLQNEITRATSDITSHLEKATNDSTQLNKVILESSSALGSIRENMEGTLSETNVQLSSVDQTWEYVAKIVTSIDNLEESVISQASHISDSSASIEEMVANIESIRSVAAGISKTVDTLTNSSANGNAMLQKLAEEVEHLHQRSEMLQEANKIIEDIAAKTNLLAMNAAIEAAHAGETGKGFAVVASEVRKLAESASKESKSISEEISKMEDSINSITSVTEQTVKSMNLIFNEITSMDRAFSQVNSAVDEQASGGAQILHALKSIKDETEKVRTGSEDIHVQSGSISTEMQKLQEISMSVTKRVTEVNDASKQISSFLDSAKEIVST
ncbi:MAG: methyl-accepting chemotaxis protein [Treponema sp.]|nr:methyl-accepting chemotaxis protein [Treponema sp.]